MSQSVGRNCIVTTDNNLLDSKEYSLDQTDTSEICDKYRNNNLLFENKADEHFCDDEIITVVVNDDNCTNCENSSSGREITVIINETKSLKHSPSSDKNSDRKNSESKSPENDIVSHKDDKSTVNYPKSILATTEVDKTKSLQRKKSVSFDTEQKTERTEKTVEKFVSGEEIIDKQNPFRFQAVFSDIEKFTITKSKKSAIPTKANANKELDNDFITKEEILKQSKYVPVYIRNPDKQFTYDKSILDRLNSGDLSETETLSPKRVKKLPVPVPRKSKLPEPRVERKRITRSKPVSNASRYPDLSDIKVKIGTDLDESLYDPNEVVLNVKKFDSRFGGSNFGSQDDLDDISDLTIDEPFFKDEPVKNGPVKDKPKPVDVPDAPEENKGYTNTVNSKEFREYLKRKGLLLFPVKANGVTPPVPSVRNNINNGNLNNKHSSESYTDKIEMAEIDDRSSDRKKSVFSRLSSIFSKGKTTPKESPVAKNSYLRRNDDPKNNAIKRVVLERSSFQGDFKRSSISANDEFTRFNNRNYDRRPSDEEKSSSISSVLSAIEDYVDMAPNSKNGNEPPRQNYVDMTSKLVPDKKVSMYRNIDVNQSKLFQSKAKQNFMNANNLENPIAFETNSKLGNDVIKPKVQRPISANSFTSEKSLITKNKPPVPIRRSSERQSMPVQTQRLYQEKANNNLFTNEQLHLTEKYKPALPERTYRINDRPVGDISRMSLNSSFGFSRTPNTSKTQLNEVQSSTPNNDKVQLKSPELSPIKQNNTSYSRIYTSQPLRTPDQQYTLVKKRPEPGPQINKQNVQNIVDHPRKYLVNGFESLTKSNNYENSANGNFVRNSPQRNTISDMYGNRFVQIPQPQQPIATNQSNQYQRIVRSNMKLQQQVQPRRSQSVLDGVTSRADPLYGEVNYRNQNGQHVTMRRPESATLDKKQIMQKIYEYYRKSVNNTPVPFQDNNLHVKSPSTDTSPVSYASVSASRVSSTLPKMPQRFDNQSYYTPQQKRGSMQQNGNLNENYENLYAPTSRTVPRSHTISESDSVFLPENEVRRFLVLDSKRITPAEVMKLQQQVPQHQVKNNYDSKRIYDRVYSPSMMSHHNNVYGQIKPPATQVQSSHNPQNPQNPQVQYYRPASAMGYFQPEHQPAMVMQNGRTTPLILQSIPSQSYASRNGVVYHNVYRPISSNTPNGSSYVNGKMTPQPQRTSMTMHTPRQRSDRNPKFIYESESGSEAGEIQRIMQNRISGECSNISID